MSSVKNTEHHIDWLLKVNSCAAEEVSDPQEPHLTVLKGSSHCFVFLLITKADCNNDQQWDASSGKDAHKLVHARPRTQTHTLSCVTCRAQDVLANYKKKQLVLLSEKFWLTLQNLVSFFLWECVFVYISDCLCPFVSVSQEQLADSAQSALGSLLFSDSCHISGWPLNKQRWTWSMLSHSGTG